MITFPYNGITLTSRAQLIGLAVIRVYKVSTQAGVSSRDPTCPALPCILCDVCGLDRAFQCAHHQPGRKRGIWHVSTGIPVTWEMRPAGT
ncbi:hypothetical protein AMECASPLE_010597 [Ameca splendens]|uniref:Uncharacterized protein n=1 Tax=Ameca splendens TaxID=208324 RepID=A0ABV0Y0J4_9TELE